MKRKLFFITFLMLFCSSMFGQHWTMTNSSQYNNSMTMFALVELNGVEQSDVDIELAAFCEGALRGVTKPFKATDSNGDERYLYQLNIYGNNNGDNLRFKIYVPGTGSNDGKEYDTDYTAEFVVGGEIWGDNENYEPLSINFYEKHFPVVNDYELSMTLGATVKINGVDPKRTDLELAALCGDEVRGVTKAIYWQSQDIYYYELIVGGRADNEEITFKLYDPIENVEFSTDYKAIFENGATIDDGHGKPLSIEFKNNPVARIGEEGNAARYFATLEAAVAAATEGETIQLLPVEIAQGTVKLPVTLKNVTVKGAEGAVLKDMTIMASDGSSFNYEGITFDGVVFENSGISVTGWRNNGAVVKDFTVKNCIFKNLNNTTNVAPIHFNMAATEPVNGLTFTNNVIDGATGGSKSGVYAQVTGETVFTGNTINNVSFRPYVIQLTTDDGITDNFTVTGNTFSGSAAGRAQGLGNNAEGTDAVTLTVSNNIFKGITATQQICYWNFNAETTIATLEKNYYDIDITANPSKIYYNSAAASVDDLYNMGIYPIYTELNEDGTINEESLFDPVAYNGTVAYETLADAFDGQNGTIVLLENIELTEGVVVAADKTFTLDLNGKVVSMEDASSTTAAMIKNNGNLTIDDSSEKKTGKLTFKTSNPSTDNAYASNTISNYGTITIRAGLVENTSVGGACYALDNYAGSSATIDGGKLTAEKTTVRIFNWTNGEGSKATLNVNAGEIYSKDGYGININSGNTPYVDLNIKGGTITTDDTDYKLAVYVINKNSAENFNVDITNGTFNGNVAINGVATQTMKEDAVKVSGGTFNGEYGVFSYADDAVAVPVISITGGIFATDYSEVYALDDGFEFVKDETTGTYSLKQLEGLSISNLHELIAFRNAVNAGNTFAGQTVVLANNIDLGATRSTTANWIPIGTNANPFKGTFDGGNKTISNMIVEGEAYQGFFGYANEATIKNVKIENATVTGTDCVGAIAGNVYSTSLIDNCHVSGSIKIEGQTNVGGIVGKYYTKVTNCSVIGDGVSTSYVKGVYEAENFEGDNIGGIMGHAGENNTHSGNTVKNITISGTRKVGGLIGVTDQNTDIANCLVENVNIETTATAEYATANKTKAGHASLVGSYTKLGNNNDGTVNNCVVKKVNFLNPNNVEVSFGPITGGAREGMIAPTGVTASGNLIYMSSITGEMNNYYLMNAVAKIGETNYYTLQDAVDAGSGKTINVIASTTENITIAENANITLNFAEDVVLNGYIAPFQGNLTVKGGTINNTNADYSAIEINAGKLNLENVKVSSARHGVRIDGAVVATIDGGEYTLNATSGTRHAVNVSGGAEVTIEAGKFVGPKGTTMDSGSAVCVQTGATVTIEGGDFSGGKNATLGVSGTMIVKGGTFDQDVTAYCTEGYVCQKNAEGKYEVFFAVAQIGEVNYKTLAEAFNAVKENETITMLADVTLTETVTIEKAITLDLNNTTVTGADGAIVFNVKAAATIKNGAVKGNKSGTSSGLIDIYADLDLNGVTIETSKINALRFKAGECTTTLTDCNVTGAFKGYGGSVWEIKSGTYKASSTSINDQLNGTASVSGGTFHYEIAEEECAPGYVVVNNGDGTWTVKYAPAAFVDANNNGTLDEGEAVYGNLDQVFANHKEGDVYIVLTANIVANAQVDTDADAHYYITTNVAEGVTMDFLFADDWNYIQKMTLGQNITLNAKHLLAWTKLNVGGIINTDYLYTTGAETTIAEGAVVNVITGDATVQVKNGAEFTVNGTLNTSILNVWVGESKLIVSGANAEVNASWIDIWDGTPSVTVQNGATLDVDGIKASRGGSIAVDGATLKSDNIELGHNGESTGELTVTNNSTIDGKINLTAVGSTVEGSEGLNVVSGLEGYMVIYENNTYKLVPIVEQTITLEERWNWMSHYVVGNNDLDILTQLKNGLGEHGVQIKNQNQFIDYGTNQEGVTGWWGDLKSSSVKEMYKINTNLASGSTLNVKLSGAVVNPESYPITLNANWNYIGYPLTESVAVKTVFASVAKDGDYVKSQDAFAEYYNGNWHGNLKTMTPGEGYMYRNVLVEDVDVTKTLIYSYPRATETTEANITAENNHWVPTSSQYADNMTMVAMLGMENDGYEVAAFVNGEVRGSARATYIESLDAYMFFLTIHGEGVEEMTFKCYDLTTGEEYVLDNRMNYSNDAVVGSIREPYMLTCSTLGIGEASMSEVSIYPNPTTTGNEINLGTTCDTVEVFNALGVKIAEYQNVDTIDAIETAGVYMIRVTNNGNVQNCRLVVK